MPSPALFLLAFVGSSEWGRMSRDHYHRVAPATSALECPQRVKRPALPKWRALEHELAAHETVELCHFKNGERLGRDNTSARVLPATLVMQDEIVGGLFRRHPDRRVVVR